MTSKERSKRELQDLFERVRAVPPGPLRSLSIKRWEKGMSLWLGGDYNSVIVQCSKIASRLEETGYFKNQDALLTQLFSPLRHEEPSERKTKMEHANLNQNG